MDKLSSDILLSAVSFVILDTETTGLSPEFGDRICEIAMLKIQNGVLLDSYQTLVNPGCSISAGASAVNQITDDMVQGKPYFKEIADDILKFIGNSVLVIHNAPFDLNFLSAQFHVLGKPIFENLVMDTLYLSRKYYRFPSNRLSTIGELLQIKINQLHRAFGDVAILKEIFDHFLKEFGEQGVKTLGDLLSLQGGSVTVPSPEKIILPPQLEEAIQSQKTIEMYYIDSTGHQSKRKVDPIDIISKNDYVYLVAHCHLRSDQRTFRLDRVVRMELLP